MDEPSRRQFLALAGGTGALSVLLAACGEKEETIPAGEPPAPPKTGATKGDLAILQYALTLEYLESDFYGQAIESGAITSRRIAEVVKAIGDDEEEHVQALTQTLEGLGAKPGARPQTKFGEVLAGGQRAILETAATVENLGASAYLGQAGRISDPEILASALSIHSNEGRHAAVLNHLLGRSIVPDGAFAKPASMEQVLAQVKPFIVG